MNIIRRFRNFSLLSMTINMLILESLIDQKNIKNHLEKLKTEFILYFPEWKKINPGSKNKLNPFLCKS